MEIQVFAEGFDIKFLSDYISFLNIPIDRLILNKTNGWTNLHLVASKFNEASNKNVKNIVIFDANGNFQRRQEEILLQGRLLGIQFELFLFPNNYDSGCFENLLLNLVQPQKQGLLTCFDSYCDCITEYTEDLIMPLKSKVFAFLEATKQPLKLEGVNFKGNEYWNLSHEILSPLKMFLEMHIV